MDKTIRFTYKLLINANVKSAWEKHIFEETFNEFLIQSAIFQTELKTVETFSELQKINANAIQLNQLLAFRITSSIEILNNNIYSVIDYLEDKYLEFERFKIDLLESNINDKNKHQLNLCFISKPYVLHDFINGYYLVSKRESKNETDAFKETQMFEFQKNLSISYIKTSNE